MGAKIPSVKKVPSEERLATRGGALELVGYLNGLLSVFGKIRGVFNKEPYNFDKVVGTSKDMIKNLEKKDKTYFDKANLELDIELDFMKIMFEMIENYVKEGTNEKRKELLKKEVLSKKSKTVQILERANGEKKSKIDNISKSNPQKGNGKYVETKEEPNKQKLEKERIINEFHNQVEEIDKRINQLKKMRGKAGFIKEAEEISTNINTLMDYSKKSQPDANDVKQLENLKNKLSKMIQDEKDKEMNSINAQGLNEIQKIEKMLDGAPLGTQEGENILKQAKIDLERVENFSKEKGCTFKTAGTRLKIQQLEKAHLQAVTTIEEVNSIINQIDQMLNNVQVGTEQCGQIIKKADVLLVEARNKTKKLQITLSENWTDVQNKLEEIRKAQNKLTKAQNKPNKTEEFLGKYGKNPIIEYKGGITYYTSTPNTTTIEVIWNYSKNLNVLNNSDLLGGKGNKGNYQLFNLDGKKLCEQWEKITPKVSVGITGFSEIPAMKRDEMFKCIIKSCEAGKFVKG